MSVADDVAQVVATTGLTVYPHAVPKGTTPDRYVVVQAASPRVESDDLGVSQRTREATVWVRSFATDQGSGDEQVAVRRCDWAARKADEALAAWRPRFVPQHQSSTPAGRDDDQPDRIVAYAASVWFVRTA